MRTGHLKSQDNCESQWEPTQGGEQGHEYWGFVDASLWRWDVFLIQVNSACVVANKMAKSKYISFMSHPHPKLISSREDYLL